jgi:dTDP-4-dehydrorhamnose reductase
VRIVIVGSGGRLGAALAREYAAGNEVVGFTHAQLDLAVPGAAEAALGSLSWDVLINCAALTNVDYCETHEAEAMRVNAEAVRELAVLCTRKRARLISISTDYVFDGEATTPYREEDPARPISIYGESKRQGEIAMLETSEDHLAVRVSWVFGPDRPSFVDGVLKRALESDKVEAIGDKFAAPAYTRDIAKHLRPFLHEIPAGGLLHLCNGGACSWREYGEHALRCAAACGVPLKTETVGFIPLSSMTSFVARRPVFTAMATDRLATLTGERPRPWQQAVEDFVRDHFAPRHR